MTLLIASILFFSLVLLAQSLLSLYLMLYTWDQPERLEESKGPQQFLPPSCSFSVLLPARHEAEVISETIRQVWSANYPSHLLEVVVICHCEDIETIAAACNTIRHLQSTNVWVKTFSGEPINKPRGLNIGFQCTTNQIVTIFDAEDDVHPDIFNIINTIMGKEGCGIVQSGVQLMNFRDYWFSIHNVLEYFFWFKSRLHFHAHIGMIPLGGNTVFVRRDLVEKVGGWNDNCLTEDADLGMRLSALGEAIRVVYDAQHVTREETPDSVRAFVRQRTRWHQGFLQILRLGTWRGLAKRRQRLLAVYTLSYPMLHAFLILLWPLGLGTIVWLKLPLYVTMIAFLPLYTLMFQLMVGIVGAWMFTREYQTKFPLCLPFMMILTFLPYQLLLGISAVRAAWRELRSETNWEKTQHLGSHRLDSWTRKKEIQKS